MTDAARIAVPSAPPPARASVVVPGLIFGVLAGLPLVGLAVTEGYLLDLATRIMIFAIAAVALDLVVGYGALVSFGHAAFIGLGAYAVGILGAHGVTDLFVSLPLALGVSMLFALATGAVGPNDRVELGGAHLERQIVGDDEPAEAFAQMLEAQHRLLAHGRLPISRAPSPIKPPRANTTTRTRNGPKIIFQYSVTPDRNSSISK